MRKEIKGVLHWSRGQCQWIAVDSDPPGIWDHAYYYLGTFLNQWDDIHVHNLEGKAIKITIEVAE